MDTIQRFRIDGVLGQGGMGTVYRAWDPELERAVAIKLLHGGADLIDGLDDRRTLDLRGTNGPGLLGEARAMAAISHPNVLPIFEVGRVGTRVFLVMELIEGVDLARWLAAEPRALAEILEVLVAAARGLAAAHARGVVHGDFKPDNILLGAGRVLVADFGVSSFTTSRKSWLRIDGPRGTPEYTAPEVWNGAAPTPAADVFGFAATAVEALLGGEPPPATDDPAALVNLLAARGLAAPACAIIARGLASDPAARPPDGAALVAALEPPAPAMRPRRRWRWIALAGAALAIAGAALAIAGLTTLVTARRGGSAAPACALESDRDAAVWSPARATALRTARVADVDKIIAVLDARFAEAANVRLEACRARAAGTLGSVQEDAVVACLARFSVELDERLRRTLAFPDRAAALVLAPPAAGDCRGRLDPPAPDAAKQRAVIARFLAGVELPKDEMRRTLAALPDEAIAAGDHELAARTLSTHAKQLAATSYAAARGALEQARKYAQQAGSLDTEFRVLCDHLKVARFYNEHAVARLLANDAEMLLERRPTSVLAERTLGELAQLALAVGEAARARDLGMRVLAIIERDGRGATLTALERRLDVIRAIAAVDEPPPADYRTFVETTHAMFERLYVDTTTPAYRAGTFALAAAYRTLDDPRGDQLAARGHELIRTATPRPGESTLAQRALLAGELYTQQQFAEALAVMGEVIRDSARPTSTDVLAENRREVHLVVYAEMALGVDDLAEARSAAEDALLVATGKVGPTHPTTLAIQITLVEIAIEQRDHAAASKHLDALDRALRREHAADLASRASLLHARLARARGDLAGAERIARTVLAGLAETKATETLREARGELGHILAARPGDPTRDGEAVTLLLESLPIPTKRTPRDCRTVLAIATLQRVRAPATPIGDGVTACIAMLRTFPRLAPLRARLQALRR